MPKRRTNPLLGALAAKIQPTRIAHLATIARDGRPHLVPVCFVSDGRAFYIPLDRKPKRTAPMRLLRVRNIQAHPNVALLIDHYEENWDKLWFVLLRGRAALLRRPGSKEHRKAMSLLKKKYPQYAAGFLAENAPLIRILPKRVSFWGGADESAGLCWAARGERFCGRTLLLEGYLRCDRDKSCPGWESNPHAPLEARDFKSPASAIPPPGPFPATISDGGAHCTILVPRPGGAPARETVWHSGSR